jgi:hypothetical protein
MTMRVATKAVGETDRTKSRPPKTATSVWMLQAARSERQGFTNSRIGPDIQGCRARCRSPGEARVTGHKVGNDSIGTRPCSLHGCPSELLLLRVPVQIFLWDIVLRHLVRANFSRGIPSSVLDALHGICFERVSLFEQFVNTLRVRTCDAGQSLQISGLLAGATLHSLPWECRRRGLIFLSSLFPGSARRFLWRDRFLPSFRLALRQLLPGSLFCRRHFSAGG